MEIHALLREQVFEQFHTGPRGLREEEAAKRLREHGLNRLSETEAAGAAGHFISQFKDLFSLLLLVAALLAAIANMVQLSLAILAVVVVNAAFSFIQERRAEEALRALRRLLPFYAKVIRDGDLGRVSAEQLVPGDLVVLEEGDKVPADCRLIEASGLTTNNAALTGESEPQPKTAEPMLNHANSWLDTPNIAYMGTTVASGYGKGVIFGTGMQTRFGTIAKISGAIHDAPSPLQKQIAYAARLDFVIAAALGVTFFLIGFFWLRLSLFTVFLFMIGVMVACVPEGLQVTVSTALALSVMRMARRNVLVKRLSSVETLGGATVICTDKTGTITKGEMTVRRVWVSGRLIAVSGPGYEPGGTFTVEGKELAQDDLADLRVLLEIAGLCNNAKVVAPTDVSPTWSIIGDPTDGSLLIAALKLGLNIEKLLAERPRLLMIPFDSVRKRMSVVHQQGGRLAAYVKGAPKETLSVCAQIIEGSTVQPLDQRRIDEVNAWKRRFGEEGLRIIAVAYRELPVDMAAYTVETVERDLVFVGLVGIVDPPRPEVKEAVEKVKRAGVKVILITGDYGPTALAAAREARIVEGPDVKVWTGAQVDALSDEQLLDELRRPEVIFARASPEHKMRIVSLLKSMGEVVAVTGDGANDAPSLKIADVGVAMGASGTDVARESADMILLDDSFASIVNAVEEGRTIYENIKKFTVYVFAHNWAELIPYLLFVLAGIPLPLLPTQVLAIDLGIDVAPSLALSLEPPEPGVMSRPPRSRKEKIFNFATIGRSLFLGLFISLGALLGCLLVWTLGGWRLGQPLGFEDPLYKLGTTMTFAGIVMAQVGNVFACRTNRVSVFRTRISVNRWIWVGVASQIAIAAALIYTPFLQGIFGTVALDARNWAFLLLLPLLPLVADEVRKRVSRRLKPREKSTKRFPDDVRRDSTVKPLEMRDQPALRKAGQSP